MYAGREHFEEYAFVGGPRDGENLRVPVACFYDSMEVRPPAYWRVMIQQPIPMRIEEVPVTVAVDTHVATYKFNGSCYEFVE